MRHEYMTSNADLTEYGENAIAKSIDHGNVGPLLEYMMHSHLVEEVPNVLRTEVLRLSAIDVLEGSVSNLAELYKVRPVVLRAEHDEVAPDKLNTESFNYENHVKLFVKVLGGDTERVTDQNDTDEVDFTPLQKNLDGNGAAQAKLLTLFKSRSANTEILELLINTKDAVIEELGEVIQSGRDIRHLLPISLDPKSKAALVTIWKSEVNEAFIDSGVILEDSIALYKKM